VPAVITAQVAQGVVQLVRQRVQMERLTQAVAVVAVIVLAGQRAQAVQDLSAFATLTLLHSQHQQQVHLLYQHQVVIEFTNGQEAGA
jgi:hypothetical protein